MPNLITPGVHKFILVIDADDQMVVISKDFPDHEDIAKSEKDLKEIIGGGWLIYRPQSKWIRVSGKSGKYGQANHELVGNIPQQDSRFSDYKIRIE
jgi:hypothetical protein